MVRFPTEFRMFVEKKETPLEKGISSFIAGNIKNLTIKEEWIMLENLKEKRDAYIAELENIKATTDLNAIINERFEAVKETIAKEVEDEFNAKLAEVEKKISNYDFVIAELEAESVVAEEVTDEVNENMEA